VKLIKGDIEGPIIIEPKVFGDDRGFFMESWNSTVFANEGLDLSFCQDNHSRSQRGVLRGMHFQSPGSQGKLVRVVQGAVYDAIVDLRRSSATLGKWMSVELSAANKRMFWVPPGFAHGFLTLEDDTDFLYKCTAPYRPEHEHTLAWDDPSVAILWPLSDIKPRLSAKDVNGLSLDQASAYQ
jgi:dTDP-4-dehydrorhamnose 3,5-epimerase